MYSSFLIYSSLYHKLTSILPTSQNHDVIKAKHGYPGTHQETCVLLSKNFRVTDDRLTLKTICCCCVLFLFFSGKVTPFMAKSASKWCIWGTLFVSLLFIVIAGILYLVKRDEYVKVILSLLLTSFFIWLLLICCSGAINRHLNPFRDCLSFVLWSFLFLFVLFLIGYAFHLLTVYDKHNKISIHLGDSSLIQFNLTSSPKATFLNYTIALKVSVSHGRKKSGVYFDSFHIRADYQNRRFSSISFPAFYVAGKTNTSFNSSNVILQPILEGIQRLELTANELNRYQQDAAGRIFEVDFSVDFKGFRCTHDEYEEILKPRNSSEVLLKHRLKGNRSIHLKGMSLPNGTGEWTHRNSARFAWLISLYCVVIFLILVMCSAFCATERVSWIGTLLFTFCLAAFIGCIVREVRNEHRLPFRISDTDLSDFNFSPVNGSLTYNLFLTITIGPNKKKTGIYYNELEVVASYHGHRFAAFPLASPSYLQGKQKHGGRKLVFHPAVEGKSATVLAGGALSHYKKDRKSGCYTVNFLVSYKGFKTNSVEDFLQGKKVQGVAKLKRKFPERCNKKQNQNGLVT